MYSTYVALKYQDFNIFCESFNVNIQVWILEGVFSVKCSCEILKLNPVFIFFFSNIKCKKEILRPNNILKGPQKRMPIFLKELTR
jgi:hypothetical protein